MMKKTDFGNIFNRRYRYNISTDIHVSSERVADCDAVSDDCDRGCSVCRLLVEVDSVGPLLKGKRKVTIISKAIVTSY